MKLLYYGREAVHFGTQIVTFGWKENNAYIFCPQMGGSTSLEVLLPFYQTTRTVCYRDLDGPS